MSPPARTHASRIHDLSRAVAKSRQMFLRRNIWTSILALREVSKASIVVELILGIDLDQLLEVELVSQHGADAAEAFDELVALARTVGDEFKGRAEVLVVLREPFEEGALVDEFHFLSGFFVGEHLAVGFLAFVGVQNDFRAGRGSQNPACFVISSSVLLVRGVMKSLETLRKKWRLPRHVSRLDI